MKILILIAAVFALNSCNTSIGIYRDAKGAFEWTKSKFQNDGSGGVDPGYDEEYGAPID